MSDQTKAMLFVQEYSTYYAYAAHESLKVLPKMIDGRPAHAVAPCKISGHECYNVLVWCKYANRHQPDWAAVKLPSMKSFMRYFKTLAIAKTDNWVTVRDKLGADAATHMAEISRHYPKFIACIQEQVERYRTNKHLECSRRFAKQTSKS